MLADCADVFCDSRTRVDLEELTLVGCEVTPTGLAGTCSTGAYVEVAEQLPAPMQIQLSGRRPVQSLPASAFNLMMSASVILSFFATVSQPSPRWRK